MGGLEELGSPTFAKLAYAITAIGALGAAAAGIVDATKVFWGGMSNVGFNIISRALHPFGSALDAAVGPDGNWLAMMKAHWLNGRPEDEQKAIATSLIRTGLSPHNAPDMARISGVSSDGLAAAAAALAQGSALSEAEINILGRFNTAIEARLDAAFERADQMYRNASKCLAAFIAVALATVAGWIIFIDQCGAIVGATTVCQQMTGISPAIGDYFGTRYFGLAIIIGLVAVPLAPVSKDLISALGTAVKAMKVAKG